ncbi:phosphonate C-P lyase system protein PhnG [Arcobacter sp. FWKO B]|uniref:phosphonate C-P lyase system protein PhnG n=1 Tax=Arcobacter sp. FWKO B TaxID=2593672 RepID=UPI0018A45B90|nr:phosphonate C-P lyase system protein PhnG [Arcobacter sp. FWKO B]QOG12343.1 hypothetical protein FWKOB_06370 [Arcobacter sp. FWKO B]
MSREDLNFLLQKVEIKELEKLYKKIDKSLGVNIINQPTSQTLLVPIKDPISGGEFYAGEALVTSCIVEVNKAQGWSMVQDDNDELSLYIATIDAVFESGVFQKDIEKLYTKTIVSINNYQKQLNKKVNSTRVSFDLM